MTKYKEEYRQVSHLEKSQIIYVDNPPSKRWETSHSLSVHCTQWLSFHPHCKSVFKVKKLTVISYADSMHPFCDAMKITLKLCGLSPQKCLSLV